MRKSIAHADRAVEMELGVEPDEFGIDLPNP